MKVLVLVSVLVSVCSGLKCFCNDPNNCDNGICVTDGTCRTWVRRERDGSSRRGYQCIDQDKLFPPERPFACENSDAVRHRYVQECCKNEDLCNENISLSLVTDQETTHPGTDMVSVEDKKTIYMVITVLACVVVILATGCCVYIVHLSRGSGLLCSLPCHGCSLPCMSQYTEVESKSCDNISTTTIQDLLTMTCSGSGSGLPLLLQRTVARQVVLKECCGKGRFGEVRRGVWRGSNVAVKIFSSLDEKSWVREVEVYQTSMLRHDNILGFIAADNKDDGTCTQLWLITHYMDRGSLYDYLTLHTLTPQQAVKICLDIATGLTHLHLEIQGTQGKPAIAHRDLKSKNILVSGGDHGGVLTCAIGDLGLAVRHNSSSNSLDLPLNCKVGTKRYLAPEVLDGSIIESDFESFKQGDIYALGLVMWEVVYRIQKSVNIGPSYQPPYWDLVGVDPSLDEMRKVVCLDMMRPDIPAEWELSEPHRSLGRHMSECWYSDPAARLTALRVKKSIQKLYNQKVPSLMMEEE